MTDAPRNAYVKFGYDVDSASEARIKASTDLYIQHLRFMARATEETGTTAKGVVRGLAAAFEAQANTVKATVRSETAELQKLRDEYDKTGASAKKGLNVEGLRRTGGALSQLGAGEIGGAVQRVGDIGQIGKEAGTLLAALGPLAPALVAVTGGVIGFEIGLKLVDAQLSRVTALLNSALDTQKTYYDFVQTATSREAKLKIENLKQIAYFQQQAVDESQRAIDSAVKQFNLGGLSKEAQEAIPGAIGKNFQKLYGTLESGQKALDDTNTLWGRLEGGLKSGAFLGNDFAKVLEDNLAKGLKTVTELTKKYTEAQAKLGAELRKAGDAEINRIKDEQRVNKELTSFSYEQAQARIKQIEDEKAVNDKIILTRGLANSQLDRNSDAYKKNHEEMKAATEANEALNRELGVLNDAMNNLPVEIDAANKRVAASTQKYNDDVKGIEQRSLEQRAAIQERYNDKLVEIARATADAAEKSLIDAQRAAEDMAISRAREENKAAQDAADKRSDIVLNAQREEAKALRAHQRELEQIRADARAREVGFLLRRDFESLFLSRLQTTSDIEKSNTTFGGQQGDRREAQQQQLQDLARSLERERRTRQQAAAEQLQDANRARARAMQDEQRARERELRLAAEARDRDLRSLSQKTTQELNLKRQGYEAEIRMVAMYGKARLDAEMRIQQELLRQAQRLTGYMNGSSGGVSTMTQSTNTTNRNITANFSGVGLDQLLQQVVGIVKAINR